MLSLSSTNEPQRHASPPRGFLGKMGISVAAVPPDFATFERVAADVTLPASTTVMNVKTSWQSRLVNRSQWRATYGISSCRTQEANDSVWVCLIVYLHRLK